MRYINCNFLKYNLISPSHVIRIGSVRDGGYYSTKRAIEAAQFLLSGGISYNAEFERDFKTINSEAKIIMVDGSFNLFSYILRPIYWMLFKKSYIKKIPNLIDMLLLKSQSVFIKRYIGISNGLTIRDILNQYNLQGQGFLKLDIEGAEYNVLKEIIDSRYKFNAIAIEFHDVPNRIGEINNFIAEIGMSMIGFCINETGKLDKNGMPNTIELSFVEDAFVTPNEYDIVAGKTFSNEVNNELLVAVVSKENVREQIS